MPLQFTTPRRRTVRQRRIKHRTPTTLREKMIAGLRELGFRKVESRTTKYDVFSHGDKKWYVGLNGALRIGNNTAETHSAGAITKELVLTAPKVKPIVWKWLGENYKTDVAIDASVLPQLAQHLIQTQPELSEINPRVIMSHINSWWAATNPGFDR
jgi:hypothetical protein